MQYFKLIDDLDNPPGRWFLGELNFDDEWDFWKYISVGRVDVPKKDLFVSLRKDGFPIDFTFADFELMILNEKAANLMSKDDVQFIPVAVNGCTSGNPYYLTTIINEIDCVDEEKSVFDRWELDNDIRPDKAGQYKTFYKLFVNQDKCEGSQIFRLKNYNSVIIVNESLKREFERNNLSGVKFQKVSS
ncbi:MAG: hypothetical protein J0L67_14495 [Cytophagales bacterium]|nr:hypothetical protein [Cytophagales bacterium]